MGQHNFKPNFEEEFEKDKEKEKEFLNSPHYSNLTSRGLKTEIDCMIESYNEMIDLLARTRFDSEIIKEQLMMEPNNQDFVKDQAKNERLLKLRRISVKVLRNQILKKLGEEVTEHAENEEDSKDSQEISG